ncbi:hypothetical protein [Cellulosimicrobium sp. Marseille-Q4280]|uniref:hypothetical protein n=1 Tax=Cellulosimicrobium sp. Marseille-Q4280 TaxID=2937992 RepID=UPI00203C152D|nr:hypothetical protein [Cellulosimicrobium sp. Marseille-Q4280]
MSSDSTQARTPAGVRTGGQFATTARAESPVHLHVGIGPHAAPLVEVIGDQAVGIDKVYNEGDSWDVWGERAQPGGTRHVVIEAQDADAATKLAGVLEGTGVLQRADDGYDTLWAVTDTENWSSVVATDADTSTRPEDREIGAGAKDLYVEAKARPLVEALSRRSRG